MMDGIRVIGDMALPLGSSIGTDSHQKEGKRI